MAYRGVCAPVGFCPVSMEVALTVDLALFKVLHTYDSLPTTAVRGGHPFCPFSERRVVLLPARGPAGRRGWEPGPEPWAVPSLHVSTQVGQVAFPSPRVPGRCVHTHVHRTRAYVWALCWRSASHL